MLRLGLDIGGTKIEAQLLDEQGQCLLRQRIPTPNQHYTDFLAGVTALVTQYRFEFKQPFSIGIGLPGAISPDTGRIKNSNILILNGEDLRADLEQQLNQPVALANDADCFALSEAVDGAGKDGKTVFGAILGTGCGGGVVVNKQLSVARMPLPASGDITRYRAICREKTACRSLVIVAVVTAWSVLYPGPVLLRVLTNNTIHNWIRLRSWLLNRKGMCGQNCITSICWMPWGAVWPA